ncbi:MAG: UDP-N-acetyl-D-mannosamine dehydrogenase [Porticoccaceae bacterium]|nr:UDP-N-acetyl-D-mannosamine dehydrogenase [Porticoccaceae bacterium]|tara:strand:+ start:742 stop:1956 length:1215 start_codon:yes stop_codon:yes gene_type:complete
MVYRKKSVSVIGLGYIGLPTAALLASKGYMVKGMDINEHAVETINKGEIHILEPDLDAYVRSAVANGKLKAYSEVQAGDIYIICVPTPFHIDSELPKPNVDYVSEAAESISPHVKGGDIVILESTSPVGTTEMVRDVLQKNGVDTSAIFVAYCPERVLPGKIMSELVDNARVIGGINSQSTEIVAAFYRTFVNGEILETEAKTAEMCKLTENSFRDVNIAFANELSVLCDSNGVDVWELIKLANHHPRVNILQPGTGVGGHCIAVDPWFIVSQDLENSRIIKTAREINDSKPDWVVDKIKATADSMSTKKVVCLGLAFKPDIDDLRESPAVRVVESLVEQGYDVSCVEPNINEHKKYNLIDIKKAIAQFDVIALLVKHKEFTSNMILPELESKGTLDFCGTFSK